MIRTLGRSGIAEMVERNCAVAAYMAERIAEVPGIASVVRVTLNQFMIRIGDDDALTLATIEQIQRDSIAFFGAAQWRGQWVMRASVSSIATTMAEADLSMATVTDAWAKVRAR